MTRTQTTVTSLVVCLSLFLSSCLGGCATIVSGGATRPVKIKTTPVGAQVYVNDAFEGKTPLVLNLDRASNHRLRIEQEGYPPYERVVSPGFNGWFLGNILIGGIIGVAVDLISGAVQTPTPGSINLDFAKEYEKALAGESKYMQAEAASTQPASENAAAEEAEDVSRNTDDPATRYDWQR
ncbi:MAG: PEGA domain-containing protein [Planctomycetota bacterium]